MLLRKLVSMPGDVVQVASSISLERVCNEADISVSRWEIS